MPEGGANVTVRRPPAAADFVAELARFLAGPTPRVLLVKGAPGAGKSSLLRAVASELTGETVFVAYRALPSPPVGGVMDPTSFDISLLLMERGRGAPPGAEFASGVPIPFAPVGARGGGGTPAPLQATFERVLASGGGCLVVDSWDRGSEEEFRRTTSGEVAVTELASTARALREQMQHVPLHMLIAIAGTPDDQFESEADGIVAFESEEIDGARVRVAHVIKLRGHAPLAPRRPYTLEHGRFYTPPDRGAGAVPPFGPPDDTPSAAESMIWPGTSEFARAFGWLRPQGLTGIELTDGVPDRLFEVMAFPIVAATVRDGGRVVWIPPGATPPALLVNALGQFVPDPPLNSGLRILSASGHDPALAHAHPVLLPIRRATGGGKDTRTADAPPVAPIFQDAYQFLGQTPVGRPSLLVVSLDGLHALASVSGATYESATLPLIAGAYAALPRFHGIGFGRVDDPYTQALLPSADLHLRLRWVHTHPAVFGLRPRTPAHLLDWSGPDGRLRYVPIV